MSKNKYNNKIPELFYKLKKDTIIELNIEVPRDLKIIQNRKA